MGRLAETWARLRRGTARAWRFASEDVWDIDLLSLSFPRSVAVRSVRVVSIVMRGFKEDECPMQAAALTFNTLMAIVPVLALSLALARGFGNEELAKEKIRALVSEWTQTFQEQVEAEAEAEADADTGSPGTNATMTAAADAGQRDVGTTDMPGTNLAVEIDRMVEAGFERVEHISFAALGGVGLGLLIWMVVSVLGKIEASFNRVWGVAHGRSLWRKFTDYLSVLFILPFLVILASSLPVADYALRHLGEASAATVRTFLDSAFLKGMTVVSLATLCFAFVIMFMPNTRVKTGPGLAGGFISGVLFIGWLMLCAALQVGAARYGSVYGSFAIVPIVLAWVYVSWEIVLFGAEVAFAIQNCLTYRMEQGSGGASLQARALLALSLVVAAGKTMLRGQTPPFSLAQYAHDRRVPIRFINSVVEELTEAGLFGELQGEPGQFVLLRSPDELTAKDVLDAMLRKGVKPAALGLSSPEAPIRELADRIESALTDAMGEVRIAALAASRDRAPLPSPGT